MKREAAVKESTEKRPEKAGPNVSRVLGFRGLGCRVEGLGFRVWGLEFRGLGV